MLVKKEFIAKLKEFGLNSYEAKLWTALLSRGVSTAGELSDISNVPRSRAYDVLESLEKKGFIIVKLGKPIKYLAVPPKEVIERVKKKVTEEAERKSKNLEKLKASDVLSELNSLHNTGVELVDPTDKSGSFRGRDKLYEHLSSMIKNAEKEIILATTADGFQRKISKFKNDLEKAQKKGVKIRIAANVNDSNKKLIKQLNGVEIRNTNKNMRFLLTDGKEMTLMLMDDKNVHESYDSGIWIDTPYFVKNFQSMFDNEWKSMKRI
ncbi:MAG: TrmB family transcriptional regulator [Nanoarchaeota archaeon]|nr:TrmB family transcriptional regulator [Nanoarchaeota archaeon]